MKIGIISDTHGLLRPQVFEHFEGVEHILHAGDLGPLELLAELEAIAPVTIVWGNTDGMEVCARLPETAMLTLDGIQVVVIHGHQLGSPTPRRLAAAHPGAGLVVFGHTHQPLVERIGDTLLVNPGSAGPRRFSQPVSLATADVEDGRVETRLITLAPDRP